MNPQTCIAQRDGAEFRRYAWASRAGPSKNKETWMNRRTFFAGATASAGGPFESDREARP